MLGQSGEPVTQIEDFGSRMKMYETMGMCMPVVFPLMPVIARLDGKAFHSFCRGMVKPFDEDLAQLMRATMYFLFEQTNPLIAYTQSDEITLVWFTDDVRSQIFMNGKRHKMESILAGWASAYFVKHLAMYLPDKTNQMACFDCRAYNVPNQMEGANTVLWRERDATRNSILSAGQSVYSHSQLQNKNTDQVQEMLHKRGINWNDYPAWAKRGQWMQKRRVVRPFTTNEINKLPAKHEARANPNLEVERWEIRDIDMPPFGRVTNRVGVVFEGEDPRVSLEEVVAE